MAGGFSPDFADTSEKDRNRELGQLSFRARKLRGRLGATAKVRVCDSNANSTG